MPNWNTNYLTIEGHVDSLNTFVKKAKGPIQKYDPQNCEIRDACFVLDTNHEDDFEFERAKTLLKNGDPRLSGTSYAKTISVDSIFSFHQLYPIPDDITTKDSPTYQISWENENWGCKWGSHIPKLLIHDNNKVVYEFLTPWSPPLPFLKKVSGDFSDLIFTILFFEPGLAICGKSVYQAGNVQSKIIINFPILLQF